MIKSNGNILELSINFGKFWKCGFYDWRIVCVNEHGKFTPLNLIGKPSPSIPLFNMAMASEDPYDQIKEDENLSSIA